MARKKKSGREERLARVPRGPKRDIEVKAKTKGQESYIESIQNNDVTICDGAAGSGKTLMAVAMALKLLSENPHKYNRIIMVRPAIVVKGEDMGYLPGDADDKMRPFIAPMMDSLGYYMNQGEIQSLFDSGAIDVIPVAYMRGRTLNNCILIFDEAQNSRWEHMKMMLTRIGFNCKTIIEGDVTQSDLDGVNAQNNGLKLAFQKLQGVEGIGLIKLETTDVVRSPIVRRILERLD